MIKHYVCTIAGIVGSGIASIFGGWNTGMTTLIIFMALDYLTGLICAGVFKKSGKSETGGLNSSIGWKGLCKKCMTLIYVLIAYRLDLALGTNYIRDAVVIGFIANELISITENAGVMGVPLPAVITKAIDILNQKSKEGIDNE